MKKVLLFGQAGNEALPAHLRRKYLVLKMRLGATRNSTDFYTDVDTLRQLLGSQWNKNGFDLLNVMCALRAADRYFVSGTMFNVRRTIPLAVGVTNKARWSRLREPLAAAVNALSRDQMIFHPLTVGKLPPAASPLDDDSSWKKLIDLRPDCVCLFSGGADSFVGAAYLVNQRRRPIFVSHSVGPVSGLQKRLFDSLCRRFPAMAPEMLVQLRSYPLSARKEERSHGTTLRWQARDPLQRLRSSFFFSLAAILARGMNVNDIFICENGLIGAAVVFAPRDDSPYTTRPAEPHFLRAMQAFLRQAVEHTSLSIRNPFQYMTKGEVLSIAVDLGLGDLLYSTVSCWRSGNRGVRNCGQCVPCLFRQLSFAEAGMAPPPPRFRYARPIPPRNWRRWKSSELERLEDIRCYCELVVEGGASWLRSNELAVVDAVDVTGGMARRSTVEDRKKLDDHAPAKMARVISRFAHAALKRLP